MNTINLLSAISVLACNVSMATIPKQANSSSSSSNYGDIVTIDKMCSYSLASSLNGDFNYEGTKYSFDVQRYTGSYSDSAINFYSEMYFYTSYDKNTHYLPIRNIGTIIFFTLSIYDNTILSSFSYRPKITLNNVSYNKSLTRTYREYNSNLDITNLGNTLYFSNYNLGWKDNSDLPLVCDSNTSYLTLSNSHTESMSVDLTNALYWHDARGNYNNVHGSVNYCFDQSITLGDTLQYGNSSILAYSVLNYKYLVNNPTYEVIDLPNVMLSILTMPFTFFSQAFNLTLFPNTPYALNVGHTILIIVGVIGSIYLIKYLVSIFKG